MVLVEILLFFAGKKSNAYTDQDRGDGHCRLLQGKHVRYHDRLKELGVSEWNFYQSKKRWKNRGGVPPEAEAA